MKNNPKISVSRDPDGLVIGCRIPRDYFTTKGRGESDITTHAGSYHLALKQAGIECYNIMTYSSIMPGIAREVSKPKDYVHGAVAETIMAVANGHKGQRVTAGIVFGWLHDKKTGKKYGGLVCEHNGNYTLEEIEKKLRASLNELYVNGFSGKYELKEIELHTDSFVPQKAYGTALVAIVFVNYVFPIVKG